MPSPACPYSAEKLLCRTLNSSTASVETPLFHCVLGETSEMETPSTRMSVPPSCPPFTLKSSLELLPGSLATPPTNPGTSSINCTGLRIVPETCSGKLATRVEDTVAPISEVVVCNCVASAVTVQLSETVPICITIFNETAVPVVTVTPSCAYFLRLGTSTVTE